MNTINKKNDVRDIINSIRFYIMLDIVVGNSDSTKTSTYKFLKEVREKSGFSNEKINYYAQLALESLPSSFREIFEIPSVGKF
ncbi:MAG TPA: hypothetical protein PKW14_08315 [Bacteroidota bacterium]|nr:hypothetical protein [Bacteroidota bacterium]